MDTLSTTGEEIEVSAAKQAKQAKNVKKLLLVR
jgi:hypothetical protein